MKTIATLALIAFLAFAFESAQFAISIKVLQQDRIETALNH